MDSSNPSLSHSIYRFLDFYGASITKSQISRHDGRIVQKNGGRELELSHFLFPEFLGGSLRFLRVPRDFSLRKCPLQVVPTPKRSEYVVTHATKAPQGVQIQ